jgi:hypothetical protein
MEWKAAIDEQEQGSLFNAYGCRYSELQRLPYWDAARQLAIDSMHALLEGLAQDHCRNALQLTLKDTLAAKAPQIAFEFSFTQPSILDLLSLYPPPKEPKKPRERKKKVGKKPGKVIKDSKITESVLDKADDPKTKATRSAPEILQDQQAKNTPSALLDLKDVEKIHKRLLHSINPEEKESELAVLRDWLEKNRKIALTYVSGSLGIPESSTFCPGNGQNEITKHKSKYTKADMANYLTSWVR